MSQEPGNPFGLPPLDELLAFDAEAEAKARRRENELAKQEAVAAARVRVVDASGRAYGTGKRKEAIARCWVWPAPQPGTGCVTVNKRPLDGYFSDATGRAHVLSPFLVTDSVGFFNATIVVAGGGPSGQAQAVRHGIAKALQAWCVRRMIAPCPSSHPHAASRPVSRSFRNPLLRQPLRAAGLLTRDPRVVERKKPGKAKARKSFQWVKR